MERSRLTDIEDPELRNSLWRLGQNLRRGPVRPRRRFGVPNDNSDAYARSSEDVAAAIALAGRITGAANERDIEPFTGLGLDGPPVKSADEQVQARLDRFPLVNTENAEQIDLI
ncbi:MAG: hypothetical protein JWL87_321 [Candidatus Adlerbacteria bacterium]|nr:hypothetical protein [Candidatus Adlerbacteria bacterium]